ncbi:MAG TPA: carboxyl transferase domain-containing protein [Chloroflexota bacterium]|nr:carboxyl transferase domain-containing protein [Chloroflexota bacterium]
MARLVSDVDPRDPEVVENDRHNRALAAELRRRRERVFAGGGPAAVERLRQRGKLLPRERIDLIRDPGTAFVELSTLAAGDVYDNQAPGAGIVTGIGVVGDVEVVFVANDSTVKAGTYFPLTLAKQLRAQQIAAENRLPCVYLVDSGGLYLPLQAESFPDRNGFGRIFFNMARMSAAGIPQIAVVLGPCTAGGAYVPAMADQNVIVRGQGAIYLGGPPLVKAATGEDVSSEELGGADVHARESGLVDHVCDDEPSALLLTRQLVLDLKLAARPPARFAPREPAYPAQELYGLIPRTTRRRMPVRELLARIVDGSELDEFKPLYGETLLCGVARVWGEEVGIVANDGVMFGESAQKGAHFVQLCDRQGIPLLFLHDVVGFMVGKEYERRGIAKDGAKMVNAIACAQVPMISLVWGASHGAGNYAMAGRAYDPRFMFSWPNARISVMGGDEAASVLSQIGRGDAEEIRRRYECESSAWYATARLWDDGVLDPVETRDVLGILLRVVRDVPNGASGGRYGIFRM